MPGESIPRKYLAFDIETAKEVPGDFAQWRTHRPLGIICAATCASDAEPKLWHSTTQAGKPAARMTRPDAAQLVSYLSTMTSKGYTILTWNGASFDFDVLAEESASLDECKTIAHDHVDMMFHLVCMMGFGVKLQKAAEGVGLPGKAGGMSGGEAPTLWAAGEYEKVLTYVAQDVRLALQVAAECEKRKEFAWITAKGSRSAKPLPRGWKTVREALAMPLPDTSWMTTKGMSREDCLAWMRDG
ncbi:MAG: ribonuclease H-like domain-containing protein [Planctomycetes bacterium]|nr:ribonuclease H-like domain-containing protein [Planctomycetota bacterium]